MDDKNQQNLTPKQIKTIPLILQARTISEGCERAKISRDTFYLWLRDPAFKAEFERQQRAIIDEAFHNLKALTGEAVEALKGLLKAKSEGVRQRTAIAIIENVAKSIEIGTIESRLDAIERRIYGEND